MHYGAVRTDQKIAIGEDGSRIEKIHRRTDLRLTFHESQSLVDLELFAARSLLDRDEFNIAQVVQSQQIFKGEGSPP